MLKKQKTALLLLSALAVLTACGHEKGVQSSGSLEAQTVTSDASQKYISLAEAEQTSLKAAGVNKEQVTNLIVQEEQDDLAAVIEVEFDVNNETFSYVIDKISGQILEQNKEVRAAKVDTGIDEQKAKEAAISDAGLKEQDVSNLVVRQEQEGTFIVYEVDFVHNGQEYHYVVDSDTANIIEKETELVGQ